MCGICYYHAREQRSVVKPILKRYEAQKSRGSEGFGIVAFDLDTLDLSFFSRSAEEKEFKKKMEEIKADKEKRSNAILFHHRNPTSTPNLAECAHPIMVNNDELEYMYFVTHNGVIWNDSALKAEHEKLGYKYKTEIVKEEKWITENMEYHYPKTIKFNDSEALAIDLARFIEGKVEKVTARGSIAFIVLQCTTEGKVVKLHYGRNLQNPLCLEQDKHGFCLKSLGAKSDEIDPHTLFSYDYATGEVSRRDAIFQAQVTDTRWQPINRTGSYPPYNNQPSLPDPDGDKQTTLHLGKDFRRQIDEEEISLPPSMGVDEYFDSPSQVNFTVNDLLVEGNTVEDLEDYTLEEIYLVEELIDWDKAIKKTVNIDRLQGRLDLLNVRLKVLEARKKIAEEQTYGVEDCDVIDLSTLDSKGGMGFNTEPKPE